MSVRLSKRPTVVGSLLAGAAALAVAAAEPPPAHANDLRGFLGGVIGGVIGGALLQQQRHHGGGGGYSHERSQSRSEGRPAYRARNGSGSDGEPPSPAESSRALASLAPPTTQQEQAMLKSVTPSQSLGAVGASDDLDQIGKDDNAEAGRDYTSRIDDLIKRIQIAQNAQHSTNRRARARNHWRATDWRNMSPTASSCSIIASTTRSPRGICACEISRRTARHERISLSHRRRRHQRAADHVAGAESSGVHRADCHRHPPARRDAGWKRIFPRQQHFAHGHAGHRQDHLSANFAQAAAGGASACCSFRSRNRPTRSSATCTPSACAWSRW